MKRTFSEGFVFGMALLVAAGAQTQAAPAISEKPAGRTAKKVAKRAPKKNGQSVKQFNELENGKERGAPQPPRGGWDGNNLRIE